MPDRRGSQRLEKVEGADQVRVDVGARILQAVANARLGGEVVDDVDVEA